ncbi:TetR/AcrR family transcriptional regulator [Halocynthiibacter namhaensis]|uniref:TetR/AcrR family transcriptional regulator n=1 Tax=Halocynthiibacter namhaensis TaxID=1290553 RepID=UPI00068FCE74|nr:TetR/AcrR family transcriptional regulator [Halocynthiibacter namhaensis]
MTIDTQTIPTAQSADPKVYSILEAAFTCFVNYGVQRTSMADIAKAAGMSRPALYLHFPNKDAILSGLVHGYFQKASADMTQALAQPGTPAQRLLAAMHAKDGDMLEKLMATPHGPELLDVKRTAASDIVAQGEAQMKAVFSDWIRQGLSDGFLTMARVPGTPESFAHTLLLTLIGLKTGFTTVESYRESQRQIAESFGAMLQA